MLKLQYVCWRWPSWMEVRVTGHNFENWPLKDHPCHVCFKLAYWFQRRRFLNIFPIGSYVKTISADGGHLGWRSGTQDIILKVDHLRTIHAMFALNFDQSEHIMCPGSHVGFPISAKNQNLVYDHPMNISGKFGWNLFSGFREEDLKVKN